VPPFTFNSPHTTGILSSPFSPSLFGRCNASGPIYFYRRRPPCLSSFSTPSLFLESSLAFLSPSDRGNFKRLFPFASSIPVLSTVSTSFFFSLNSPRKKLERVARPFFPASAEFCNHFRDCLFHLSLFLPPPIRFCFSLSR